MLVDTHCHFSSFYSVDSDRLLLDVDSTLSHLGKTSTNSHKIGLGLHPWFVDDQSLLKLYSVDEFAWQAASLIAEIGLDFSPAFRQTRLLQLEAFNYQLALANRFNKPVSLHLVKSYQPMFEFLSCYHLKGAIHGFSGSVNEAVRFYKLGFRIGVNGLILRENTPKYRCLVDSMPLEALVLETDYPNIVYPDGRPADSMQLLRIAQRIAQIKSLSVERVIAITNQNAMESFNLVSL
ncbi:MAG: TatD family hydrolase [Thiomicrospira sp.]